MKINNRFNNLAERFVIAVSVLLTDSQCCRNCSDASTHDTHAPRKHHFYNLSCSRQCNLSRKVIHSSVPRVVLTVLEGVRLVDVRELQEWWAGLLIGSMTNDGRDENALQYAPILDRLTVGQAKIVEEVFSTVILTQDNSASDYPSYTVDDWLRKTGLGTPESLFAALASLAQMGLISGESDFFAPHDNKPFTSGTPFGRVFYARVSGHIGDTSSFYDRTR